MTNNSRPAARRSPRTCIDCNVQLNRSNCTASLNADDMCDRCFEMAGYENDHQDGWHDADNEGPNAHCPMCDESLRKDRSRKGHAGTTVARGSHAECYAAKAHPATKAARAACRAARKG